MEYSELKRRQNLSLDEKIEMTEKVIKTWYEQNDGMVYVSFSGGKDSTVLLSLVRSIYPDVKAVFCNTGLEFPEIVQFVKTIENCEIIKPKMNFKQVLEKYGYPVVSKDVSKKIYDIRNTKSKKCLDIRLNGSENGGAGKLSLKWRRLVHAPFKISDKCCDAMKKRPFHSYDRKNGMYPFIGTMAGESMLRLTAYLNAGGCNQFTATHPKSTPLSFWNESDIWQYIARYQIKYSKIYDMGYERTGCVFCMFGADQEKFPNRFHKLEKTHPRLHDYCINKLGLGKIMDVVGVSYLRKDLQHSLFKEEKAGQTHFQEDK